MKKLTIVCNSIDRLKLIDKFMFKDEFEGDVIIISDDRYRESWKEIGDYISVAENINIKKATQLLYLRDIYPYIIDIIKPEEIGRRVLKNLLFAITTVSNIYLNRSQDDMSFIIEDDILLFKNPIDLMTQLTASNSKTYQGRPAKDLIQYLSLLGDKAFKDIGIDKDDPEFENKYYKKICSCIRTS